MSYEYREPDVVETRREVVVDRDPGGGSGTAIAIVLAVLVVLGLIGWFAVSGNRTGDSTEVRVETPADTGRAQDIQINPPNINIEPPVINTPPPIINNGGGTNDSGTTDSGTTDSGTTDSSGQ